MICCLSILFVVDDFLQVAKEVLAQRVVDSKPARHNIQDFVINSTKLPDVENDEDDLDFCIPSTSDIYYKKYTGESTQNDSPLEDRNESSIIDEETQSFSSIGTDCNHQRTLNLVVNGIKVCV